MDISERRRVLFEKVIANKQRRHRAELLRRFPRSISHVLDNSPCRYSIEIDSKLRGLFPFNQSTVGISGFKPPHYKFVEVAWEDKMLSLLTRQTVPRNYGQAFLLLEEVKQVWFEEQKFFVSDGPMFQVDFHWAVPLLTEFWAYFPGGLILVEQDLLAGVLIDRYCGLLPGDLNPREIIYEIGMWPVQHDGSNES